MGFSPHIKIAGVVPRLSGRIPTQDLGEVVMTVPTTGYINMIVNFYSSQTSSWRWKVARLHVPPLKLAPASSVGGNLGFNCDGFLDLFSMQLIFIILQSGASSLAKHGGAYFSAVYGSIQDPIAAPGLFDIQVP